MGINHLIGIIYKMSLIDIMWGIYLSGYLDQNSERG